MISLHLRALAMPLAIALGLVYIPHEAQSTVSHYQEEDPLAAMVMVLCPDMLVTEDILGPGCTAMVTIPPPTEEPNCAFTSISNNTGLADPSGLYPDTSFMITWEVDDCMGSFTCMQLVVVSDIADPDLQAPPDFTGTTLPPAPQDLTELTAQGGSATDNCSLDASTLTVTTDLVSTSGNVFFYLRRFTITDVNGNVSQDFQSLSIDASVTATLMCPNDTTVACSLDNLPPFTLLNAFRAQGGNIIANAGANIAGNTFHLADTDTLMVAGCPVYDRTYAVEVDGDTLTCTQRVTVIDGDDPVITYCPADTTIYTSALSCDALFSVDTTGFLITDNCAIDTVTNNQTANGPDASDTYLAGMHQITFVASDVCGNSASCTLTLTVLDTISPVLTPPSDTTIICDISNYDLSSYTAYLGHGGNVVEACALDVTTFDVDTMLQTGSICPHIYTITYSIEDTSGNLGSAVQTVMVNDTTPPVIDSLGPIVLYTSAASCDATSMLPAITATDNCTLTDTLNSLNAAAGSVLTLELDTTVLQIWVTDACGNADTIDVTYIVLDTIAPVVIAPNDTTIACSISDFTTTHYSDFEAAGGVATDGCAVDTSTYSASITLLSVGGCPMIYEVTYTVSDSSGNATSDTHLVTVVDTIAPTITNVTPVILYTTASTCSAMSALPVIEVAENCTISDTLNSLNAAPDSVLTLELDTTVIQVWVTDACGNADTVDVTFVVLDTIAPVVTAPADTTITCDIGNFATTHYSDFEAAGGLVTDACGIDTSSYLSSSILISTGVCPMMYEITYTVSDSSGNTGSDIQIVTVNDTIPPMVDSLGPIVLYTSAASCEATSMLPTITVSDNCTLADTLNSLDAAADSLLTLELDTTIVQIWVTDACGNADTIDVTFVVLDTIAPVLSNAPLLDTAVCSMAEIDTLFTIQDARDADLIVTDNCSLVDSLVLDSIISTTTLVQRYYSVVDSSGNGSPFEQIITLRDTVDPVLVLAADTTITCGADTMSFFAVDPISAEDNCAVVDTVRSGLIVIDNDPCNYQVGISTTIIDQMGNMAIDTQMVTVRDTTSPLIGSLVGLPDTYCGDPRPVPEMPAVTDNCSFVQPLTTVIDSSRKVSCADYPMIYRYTAQDACGNSSSLTDTIMTLRDTVPPYLIRPVDTLRLSTDSHACEATHNLVFPDSTVADDCNPFVTTIPDNLSGTFPLDTTIVTWTLRDQCNNDTTVQQVVIVKDNQAPTILVSGPKIVAIGNNVPSAVDVETFVSTLFDNCTKTSGIKVTGMKIDANGNPITTCGDTSTALRDQLLFCCEDIGTDVFVMLQAEDHHGNTALTAAFRITVEDNIGPISGPSYDLPDITVSCQYPLDVNDLSVFGNISYDINGRDSITIEGTYWGLDAYVLDNCPDMTTIKDTVISDSRMDCGQGEIIRQLIVDDGRNTPLIIDQVITVRDTSPIGPSDIVYPAKFTLDDCGATTVLPSVSGIPIISNQDACSNVYYSFDDQQFTLQNGNIDIRRTWTVIDWCQYDAANNLGIWRGVQSISIICTSGRAVNVGGAIYGADGAPMSGVQLRLSGPEMELTVTSDEEGKWDFAEIPSDYSYAVTPIYDEDHREGVSTLDMVLMMRHILGFESLDAPSKMIAADVNDDQRITGKDIVELRQLILGITDHFDDNLSYRFVAPDWEWTSDVDPWSWKESWITEGIWEDEMSLDFDAIKIGDVDNSIALDNRSSKTLSLFLSQPYQLANGKYGVEVSSGDAIDLHAMEISLESRSIVGVASGAIDIDDWHVADSDGVHIAWADDTPLELESGQLLFTIELSSEDDVSILQTAVAEAYDDAFNRYAISLHDLPKNAQVDLEQNTPNPFSNLTEIAWTQSQNARVQLRLHNASGALIHRHIARYDAGRHTYMITAADIDPAVGVIFYSLNVQGEQPIVKKMIRIE